MIRVHTDILLIILNSLTSIGHAWINVHRGFYQSKSLLAPSTALDAAVGIVYGTSTGNTLD
jgi:hypothetical protein